MKNRNEFEVPAELPPALQGILLGLVFGVVLFGDAILVWLS